MGAGGREQGPARAGHRLDELLDELCVATIARRVAFGDGVSQVLAIVDGDVRPIERNRLHGSGQLLVRSAIVYVGLFITRKCIRPRYWPSTPSTTS